MTRDDVTRDLSGVTRRTVLGAGAGAVGAVAGGGVLASPAAAAPPEVGTARESAAASERGVECVADLR